MRGEARRRAHDVGDQLDQTPVLLEEREELDAGGQLGQKAVEADEGEVGIGGLGQRRDQQRLHLGQAVRARAGVRTAG